MKAWCRTFPYLSYMITYNLNGIRSSRKMKFGYFKNLGDKWVVRKKDCGLENAAWKGLVGVEDPF